MKWSHLVLVNAVLSKKPLWPNTRERPTSFDLFFKTPAMNQTSAKQLSVSDRRTFHQLPDQSRDDERMRVLLFLQCHAELNRWKNGGHSDTLWGTQDDYSISVCAWDTVRERKSRRTVDGSYQGFQSITHIACFLRWYTTLKHVHHAVNLSTFQIVHPLDYISPHSRNILKTPWVTDLTHTGTCGRTHACTHANAHAPQTHTAS